MLKIELNRDFIKSKYFLDITESLIGRIRNVLQSGERKKIDQHMFSCNTSYVFFCFFFNEQICLWRSPRVSLITTLQCI